MVLVFDTVDKEISNDLQASLGGARTQVRTKGAGSEAYLSIDQSIELNNRNNNGARVIVRTSTGILYSVSREVTDNDLEIFKSVDDGNTWVAQDTGNEPLLDTNAVACAIDSTDLIHIVYWDDGVGLKYIIFDTTTDLWGTAETAQTEQGTNVGTRSVACAIDSNDKPHVSYSDRDASTDKAFYTNKISGSWSTIIDNGGGSGGCQTDIIINDDNVPIVTTNRSVGSANAFGAHLADANNPTSFESSLDFANKPDVADFATSMVCDKEGTIHIAYADENGDVLYARHVKAKGWQAFATTNWDQTVIATGTFEDCSMTIDQAGDLYIFTNTSANVTNYFKSTNGGRTWGSAQTDDMGSVVDEHVRTRWSFLNYHFPNKLDYTVNDETANDIGFNTVLVNTSESWRDTDAGHVGLQNRLGARSTVRTIAGILYFAGRASLNQDIQMMKSDNEGNTWTHPDASNDPTGADTDAVACAIDSTGIIHVVYWDNGVGLKYNTFDTATDTWGTTVTAISDTGTPTAPGVSICIDSNDIPHVAYNWGGTNTRVNYTNRIGGTWKAAVQVQNASATSDFASVDITIDDDDIPQCVFTYQTSGIWVVRAEIGDVNNATIFVGHNVENSGVTANTASSICVDKKGDTYASSITNGDLYVKKHLKGNGWLSGWETEVLVVAGTFEDTSITLDRYGNPIVFTNNSSNVSFAYKSTDGGLTWSALDTSHDITGRVDEHIKVRWSFLNFYFPDQFDYTVNQTAIVSGIAYNKMVQTGADHLYVVGRNPTDSEIEVLYSPTEGQTWEEVDDVGSPIDADTDSVSCAIDSIDDIHITWWDNGVGLRYEIFDNSTQSHGTPETADSDATTNANPFCAIAINSADKPHILFTIDDGGSNENVSYANKISGWFVLSPVAVSNLYKLDILVDDDDIPQFTIVHGTSEIASYLGNAVNPSGFSYHQIQTSVTSEEPSIAIDSLGNTYVSYISSGDVKIQKHEKADAWTTWQTIVNVATGTFEDTSILIDALDNIVIFSNDSSNVTQAWISDDGGSTFDGGTTHNSGTVVDEHIRARWSYLNYNNPSKFDYTIFDATANDTYYNSASISAGTPGVIKVDDDTENISEDAVRILGLVRFAKGKEIIT